MNCIEILDTWMLQHSCRNKTWIEFRDLFFWFAMSNASRWRKFYHYTQRTPYEDDDTIFRSFLTWCRGSPASRTISVIPDGGRHWCYCIDAWHVAQALLMLTSLLIEILQRVMRTELKCLIVNNKVINKARNTYITPIMSNNARNVWFVTPLSNAIS